MFLRDNTTHTPVMEVNTAVPATQGSSAAGVIAVANRRATGPGRNPVSVPAPAMGSALSIRAKGYDAPGCRLPGTRIVLVRRPSQNLPILGLVRPLILSERYYIYVISTIKIL